MSNQASKVFAVPELLEAILLQLPPRDLLLAQRVDKTFRDSINKSLRIQQKLFFKSKPKKANDGTSDLNPFLNRLISLDGREWNPYVGRSTYSFYNATDNIANHVSRFIIVPYTMNHGEHIFIRNASDNGGGPFDTSKKFKHSWRKMLVADPARLVNICTETSMSRIRNENLTPESMGDLLEAPDKDWDRRGCSRP